ncbi:hypothetical protein ACO8D0_05295 [Streptomyces pratensis]
MSNGTDEADGGDLPGQGDTYTGPTALQRGDHNRQINNFDQRTYYYGAAGSPSATFADLEQQLRRRTPYELRVRRAGGGVERAAVDREVALGELTIAMTRAASEGGALVVQGEPSVGKSVLCLQAVDRLRESGAEVVVVDLRDCRPPLPTLESTAGVPLLRLFAGVPTAEVRLLVLDGAEAVQEGARDRFLALADAAHRAGLGVVAVSRDDAAPAVEEAFGMAPGVDWTKTRVEPLLDTALDELAEKFPTLRQLKERRSRWLLRRVGLVDLLLRAEAVVPLRDGALCEADVFDACWGGWVRAHGQQPGGDPSPDGRERALLDIARTELGLPSRWGGADPAVLPSLRSDGLLRSFGPGATFRGRETFVGDVVRDFATARLLLTDGLGVLAGAQAPRWAIRAALVACQARLVDAQEMDTASRTLSELARLCDELAAVHGARWADLPWEAVLSTGLGPGLMRAATPLLLRDHGAHLAQLLRVAEQRFTSAGRAEALPVEALVRWLAEQSWHTLDVPRDVADVADRIVRDWLRGVLWDENAENDETTRQVRQAVRAVLLTRDTRREAIAGETLATLGSDLDDEARDRLRQIASCRPARLRPVVESGYAIESLRKYDVELLADLALAYYVEQPGKRLWSTGDGVRGHEVGYRLAVPRAAWWYGPFWALLRSNLALGLSVVSTLLDHATTVRCAKLTDLGHGDAPVLESRGIEMDLLGLGSRVYEGDSHVYAWYRGSMVGPEPCTSALLAWERTADQLQGHGIPLRKIARLLLRNAHSLAAVGVVVGFLVRHLPAVTDELDDFLAVPELWSCENIRMAQEQIGLAIRDEEDLPGREWRRRSLRDVAAVLVARAVTANDESAADRLRQVGVRLLAAGSAEDDGRPTRHARISAELLDTRNYVWVPHENGLALTYEEPSDLTAELRDTRQALTRTGVLNELANRYSLTLTPPFALGLPSVGGDVLAADVPRARGLADDPPAAVDRTLDDTVAAVAATLVRAVGAGVHVPELTDDDLQWAQETVIAAADARDDAYEYEGTLYNRSADRSAASALPYLLLPAFDAGTGEQAAALTESMTSRFHEVRRCTALALRPVWAAPCGPAEGSCRHQQAWQAVENGTRHVAMAAWDGERRESTALDGDPVAALKTAEATDLVLPRVATALVAALDAVSNSCCVAGRATELRDALLDAYGRTAVLWAQERFEVRAEEHTFVADALLAVADTAPGLFKDMVRSLGGRSEAAAALLRAGCTAATYDADRRRALRTVWPELLESVLSVPEEPQQDEALTALIPAPVPLVFDGDMAATVEQAHQGWPTASDLSSQVEQWIPQAAGARGAVDTLIGFLQASPIDQQLRPGLSWVRALVLPGDGTVPLDSYLITNWLRALRASPLFDTGTRAHYDVLVDALTARGSRTARELQQEDE